MFKGKKIKKPGDLVKAARALLQGKDGKPDELSRIVAAMKTVMTGDENNPVNPEHATQLSLEAYQYDLPLLLVQNVNSLDFEARKDASTLFSHLVRRPDGLDYVARGTGSSVLSALVAGQQSSPEAALVCGNMLRECTRHEDLVRIMLRTPEEHVWPFFALVEQPNFDVASDAFTTFKEIMTKHKGVVAEFLETHYDKFFAEYAVLLNSGNYVTKRQSLKLLGELLLDRANFNVMTKYIAQSSNLKLMMNLLRDKSRSIQFEAFHVFKVFVANPNKPAAILTILVKNKERLMNYLADFHNDKDDEQFTDEKAYLLRQIEAL